MKTQQRKILLSAFSVSDDHINILLSWARKYAPILYATAFDLKKKAEYAKVGAILRKANNASLEARYGNKPKSYLAKTVPVAHLYPINIVAGCNCFDYQVCEYDGWEKSDAKKIIDNIRDAAIRRVVGYDQFWELSLLEEKVTA